MNTLNNLLLIFAINFVKSENNVRKLNSSYTGDKFPQEYLSVDGNTPTPTELNEYLRTLRKVSSYFAIDPNDTDVNGAFGAFLALGSLKRTHLDYGSQLSIYQKELLEDTIDNYELYLSSHTYKHTKHYIKYLDHQTLYKVASMLRDFEIVALSLPKFTRNRLKPFLLDKTTAEINGFTEVMDSGELSRFTYAELVEQSTLSDLYHVYINVSDRCLSTVINNKLPPLKDLKMQRCIPDRICEDGVMKVPSVAYSLSHRLIDIMVFRLARRCYIMSPEKDMQLMDELCASMYRECVYVAKKGYFSRDMFMEHVATCGMLGHEEFYRRNWFRKAVTWVDAEGCVRENHNFLRNLYSHRIRSQAPENYRYMRKMFRRRMGERCEPHLAAVTGPFLANAVRHAAYYVTKNRVLM